MPKYFITVAGNIGVGKSTLVKLLAERTGWEPVYEAVAENPYLADFYEDMTRWSFHSQVFFLSRRLRQHHYLLQRQNAIIQDRSVYEDAEIFARNLYQRELMPERDYHSYVSLYQAMTQSLKRPDLVVYLRASTWTLISRIRKRGRDFERSVDSEYLAQLNIGYERWIKEIAGAWNLLIVDTDNFDMYEDLHWLEGILEEIRTRVGA